MPEYFLWFDLLGIAVFAISGTLAAWRNHMDGFGVIVLASVTAIGGGTLRDLILDVPVIWINNNTYFYAIFVAAIGTILLVRNRLTIPNNTLQIADAFGLAFFVIMGTEGAGSWYLQHGGYYARHHEWRLWRHDPRCAVPGSPDGVSRRTLCGNLYFRRHYLHLVTGIGSTTAVCDVGGYAGLVITALSRH